MFRNILLTSLLAAPALLGQTAPPPLEIHRLTTRVTIDGNVTPDEWSGATKVERFYEINPGDNVEPKVKTTGYAGYDDRFFYVAMVMDDPHPSAIRRPYTDRDGISSEIDFAGIFLSTTGDKKTALELFVNPRGAQYDAINDDATGEDFAPDFYWDSAARLTPTGWTLEMRIPFSSLRYTKGEEARWSMAFFRNYTRDRRYQIVSTPVPRGSNCTVCLFPNLRGLQDLPSSSHLVLAPYAIATQDRVPSVSNDERAGADAKWTPNAHVAIDATINPDFSQVESDVAAITTNQRFAVFFPEKRPFFLEGKNLFGTPLQAVYTRDINSPRWGARTTGTYGNTAFTMLVADDRGGGATIIPGPNSSSFASEDFESRNLIGRVRHDVGTSFLSFLVTDREIAGGGHNRVFGPDALWHIGEHDVIQFQALHSDSVTPDRPDLAAEWDGRRLSSHAEQLNWSHNTALVDTQINLTDRGNDFRADLGFLPQVGTREGFAIGGLTFHPKGFFSRVRPYVVGDYTAQRDGALVYRFIAPSIEADGRWTSYFNLGWYDDRIRAGNAPVNRRYVTFEAAASPSRIFQRIVMRGRFGGDIDFANARAGRGREIETEGTIRPTDHLELSLITDLQWLNVYSAQRLFTARVERLKATYNFTARSFLRAIGQVVRTDRDPSLYDSVVALRDGSRSLSLLYAYKINWQTLLYVGYGNLNELTETNRYSPAARSFFIKTSYAWQR